MKTSLTTAYLLLILISAFNFNAQAQDIDYRLEGCIPTLQSPTNSQGGPSSQHEASLHRTSQHEASSQETSSQGLSLKQEPSQGLQTTRGDIESAPQQVSETDIQQIWDEMESLTLNMIDLEVEVLDLKAEQLKVVPFSNFTPRGPEVEDEFDNQEEYNADQVTDQVKYEMLQMARHLNGLIYQVKCIRDEVENITPYSKSKSSSIATIDYYNHRSIPVKYSAKPTPQVEDPIESFWKEMEEMAIQAMDLEVEISDLRVDLSNLKRNAWELDQIAFRKNNQNDR